MAVGLWLSALEFTRYLLGHGFSIQTESGATQSGADLKYEIDR